MLDFIVGILGRVRGLVLRRNHISHIVKMYHLFRNMFPYSGARFRQTKYIVMMSKEGSTKKINFMTPEAGGLVLGRDLISHVEKMYYFFFTLGHDSDKLTVLRCAHINHISENALFL